MKNTKKLWQTKTGLHPLVEQYTVGEDYLYDQRLVPYDIKASRAHAALLEQAGLLSSAELATLNQAFDHLQAQWEQGNFVITPDQEDVHTAIEQYLTDSCGDVGKKIHTGRSRNDQVMVMMRLYERDQLTAIKRLLGTVSSALAHATKRLGSLPMPGYTHMQRAMPTTVATWLCSFADGFADSRLAVDAALKLLDQNPLGSAAGFGTPGLPLDRHVTTTALGFAKTQGNPMYCGLSRGLFELSVLNALAMPMVLAGRLASDMLLFTTEEYGFFSLPPQYTTGSSIMPNKHNYDLFEIMRGNSRVFAACSSEVQQVVAGLYSGYARDLQLTKPPLMKGLALVTSTFELLAEVVPHLQAHPQKLHAAMSSDLFATERAYDLVKSGTPFRDAYTKVKQAL